MEFTHYIKNPVNGLFTGFVWQGQKDSSPRHAVLEAWSQTLGSAYIAWFVLDKFPFDDNLTTE